MTPVEIVTFAFTAFFLLVVISYYVLLFLPARAHARRIPFKSITILVPARNEQRHLPECIASLRSAQWSGKKQIIVIDDASKDRTHSVARTLGVRVLRNGKQLGKSASLNRGLRLAQGDLVAVVDADSSIEPDALVELARTLVPKDVAGAAAVVKVRNRKAFINIWVHLELLYASLLRSIFTKAHANVTTPGALSMYRRSALNEVGGFSTHGFSEDLDIAIRLIRAGYRIEFSDRAISHTHMPQDVKSFVRQRTRFARGIISILKRHMQLNSATIDLYTMPLFLFSYLQAIIMGAIILYQIGSGYIAYFASKGTYMSLGVAKFFFEWFSIVGTVRWAWSVLSTGALTPLAAAGILSSLLTYPLFIVAIVRYDRKFDLLHALALMFMFPFWFVLMLIYLVCTPEVFAKEQRNIWKKNE